MRRQSRLQESPMILGDVNLTWIRGLGTVNHRGHYISLGSLKELVQCNFPFRHSGKHCWIVSLDRFVGSKRRRKARGRIDLCTEPVEQRLLLSATEPPMTMPTPTDPTGTNWTTTTVNVTLVPPVTITVTTTTSPDPQAMLMLRGLQTLLNIKL